MYRSSTSMDESLEISKIIKKSRMKSLKDLRVSNNPWVLIKSVKKSQVNLEEI